MPAVATIQVIAYMAIAFNTPLEMHVYQGPNSCYARYDFQYSIGDAHEYVPTDKVVVIVCNVFQYSIGDVAATDKAMKPVAYGFAFQYSIGDAQQLCVLLPI